MMTKSKWRRIEDQVAAWKVVEFEDEGEWFYVFRMCGLYLLQTEDGDTLQRFKSLREMRDYMTA